MANNKSQRLSDVYGQEKRRDSDLPEISKHPELETTTNDASFEPLNASPERGEFVDAKHFFNGRDVDVSLPSKRKRSFEFETDEGIEIYHEHSKRNLGNYGLPDAVITNLNIPNNEMYRWQAECINVDRVLSGKSLVYSAPTASGKSLVAEIIAVRRVATSARFAIFALPYVSLCEEKTSHFERLCKNTGITVRGYYGAKSGRSPTRGPAILICTYEKASGLISKLKDEDKIDDLAVLAVDEVHMLSDNSRGALLELLLMKALAARAQREALMEEEQLQILALSATLPSVDLLADWLGAATYFTEERPIPLRRFLKLGDALIEKDTNTVVQNLPSQMNTGSEVKKRHIDILTQSTIDEGGSVLIFCKSKRQCQLFASALASILSFQSEATLCKQQVDENKANSERDSIEDEACFSHSAQREQLASELERSTAQKNHELLSGIKKGVAFHHADLLGDEREIVERGYRMGCIKVLCATSTLAAGVNLPARRVILSDHKQGIETITPTEFLQMSGRAGRVGHDAEGDSILVAEDKACEGVLRSLMDASLPEMQSRMASTVESLSKPLLEAITGGFATSLEEAQRFIETSFMYKTEVRKTQGDAEGILETTRRSVEDLKAKEMIRDSKLINPAQQSDEMNARLEATEQGKGCTMAGFTPKQGMRRINELESAMGSLKLDDDLHLLLLVAPEVRSMKLSKESFANLAFRKLRPGKRLPPSFLPVMRLAGIEDSFLHTSSRAKEGDEQLSKCRRMVAAYALQRIVSDEENVSNVAADLNEAFGMNASSLFTLQEQASREAGSMASLCQHKGWSELEILLLRLQERIAAGVKVDLLPLMQINGVKGSRARALYRSGYHTPEAVASIGQPNSTHAIKKLVDILSKGSGAATNAPRVALHKGAKTILQSAHEFVAERAQRLREEAEQHESATSGTAGTLLVKSNEEVDELEDEINEASHLSICASINTQRQSGEGKEGNENISQLSEGMAIVLDRGIYFIKRDNESFHRIMRAMSRQEVTVSVIGMKQQMIALRELRGNENKWFDARIAAWLLEPGHNEVRESEFGDIHGPMESFVSSFASQASVNRLRQARSWSPESKVHWEMGDLQFKDRAGRAVKTAIAANELYSKLKPKVECANLLKPLNEIEMPFAILLSQMHFRSLQCDMHEMSLLQSTAVNCRDELNSRAQTLIRRRRSNQTNAYSIGIDISRTKDVSETLFNKMDGGFELHFPLHLGDSPGGIAGTRRRRDSINSKGAHSTRAEVLSEVAASSSTPEDARNFIDLVKKSRSLTSMIDFMQSLERFAVRRGGHTGNNGGEDAQVQCAHLQTNTDTGRVATEAPNLQSTPKSMHTSTGVGEGVGYGTTVTPRRALKASKENTLLSVDFKQLELRLLSHFADDSNLKSSFTNQIDPFTELALDWRRRTNATTETDTGNVTLEERDRAKALAYGLIYGKGNTCLADDLNCTISEAKEIRDNFHTRLPKADGWRQEVISKCKERPRPFVETIGGRRRFINSVHDQDKSKRLHGERQAVNTVCQGSAADVVKLAMLRAEEVEGARMLLQVHDEVILEVEGKRDVHKVAKEVKEKMEGVREYFHLSVPLETTLKAGETWADLARMET